MSHIVSAVINALTAGRWLEAAPLLVDLLEAGQVATLSDLAFYEAASGQQCTDPRVRSILETRLGLLDRAQARFAGRSQWYEAERLAKIVREHGHPCRVISNGWSLRVADRCIKANGSQGWICHPLEANERTVCAWLGYSEPRA